MKRFLTLFLAAAMVISSTTVKSVKASDVSETIEQRAKRIAEDLLQKTNANSIQYTLIDNGKTILSDSVGFYDKKTNTPIQKNNMYSIGSTSKAYVSASVMSLVDKGLVNIDLPLTNYIKEFKMADSRYVKITPRMLMEHTSGIYGTSFNDGFLFDDNYTANHDNIISILQSQKLKYDPGQYAEYCNDGFTLLEILVERVSGVSYSEYLSKQFFKPLGLNTKTPQDNFDRSLIAKNYIPFYDGALPVENANLIGSGGIYSSSEDVAKFGEVLMGKYPEILSKKSALVMAQDKSVGGKSPESLSSETWHYGLGYDNVKIFPFDKFNMTALSKGGDVFFSHSNLIILPEQNISMAVCSSGGLSLYNYLFESNILQEYLKQKNVISETYIDIKPQTPVKDNMPKELEKFEGNYLNSSEKVTVDFNNSEIKFPPIFGGLIPAQTYVYTKEGSFKGEDGLTSLKFVNYQGKDYIYVYCYYILPEIGYLPEEGYLYERADESKVSSTILDSWKNRIDNEYYLVSEKATSEIYFLPVMLLKLKLNNSFDDGYVFGGAKIVDENNAVNTLKYRDVTDYNFFKDNNIEYVKSMGLTYIDSKSISNIFGGEKSYISIQKNGYARYGKIGDDVAGKTITVQIPKNASYVVYDENGIPINYTTVSKNNTTVLPKNGMIAFIGNPGDVFNITLK